jgi:SAM-dependent methyltransferase
MARLRQGKRRRRGLASPAPYHDRIAGIYDSIYEGDPYWKFLSEITWAHLKPHLPRTAGARILDAGGGTGTWAVRLARSGFQVTLADLSSGMLEAARRKAAAAGVAERIDFVQCDIAGLEGVGDDPFALALALGDPISFCGDAKRAVRALARVLVPGGICVASVDGLYGGIDPFLERGEIEGLERFVRDGRSEWLARRQEERFPTRAFTPEGLVDLFTGAGFSVLSLIGKTVLPIRASRRLLEEPAAYVRLLRLERRLHTRPALLGRASHLQIAVRRAA